MRYPQSEKPIVVVLYLIFHWLLLAVALDGTETASRIYDGRTDYDGQSVYDG